MHNQRQYLVSGLLLGVLLFVGLLSPVRAGEPQEKIRQTVDDVLHILRDEALQAQDQRQERRRQLRQAVLQRFGFEEMAQRALARHWRPLAASQQREFVDIFGNLLERSYINKIESYGRDSVVTYTKETIDKDGYALVRSEITNATGSSFEVEYRLLQRNANWEVYDVVIEGVSLVNNYRSQFNKIIAQESYEALIKKLRLKLEQEEAATSQN